MERKLLTVKEVAEILTVTKSTLKEWRRLKKGPPFIRIGHNTIRYSDELLDNWINSRGES